MTQGDPGLQRADALVIGIGNEFGRDDGVGLRVAREVGALEIPGVEARILSGDCTGLAEMWSGATTVYLVDAVLSASAPGSIHRFDATAGPIPSGQFCRSSTHTLGVAEFIELARVLKRLPPRLVLYGIEGRTFEPGFGLSPEVERSAGCVVRRILQECGGAVSP